MFTTFYLDSHAVRQLSEAHMAWLTHLVQAAIEANVSATQRNLDVIKTWLATSTVASRHWTAADGAGSWPWPHAGEARARSVPDAGMAARTSLE